MPKQSQLTLPSGEKYSFETLSVAPSSRLEEVLRRGSCPDLDGLVGWEFRGFNTSDITRLAGIRKFKKGFFSPQAPVEGKALQEILGYNMKIRQNHYLTEPWEDVLSKGEQVRHGWFHVYPVRMGEVDNRYPNGLLLNYGLSSRNPGLDPSRLLRDYLVQVYRTNSDLLLGKAFFALGFFRLFGGYFVLERHNRSEM